MELDAKWPWRTSGAGPDSGLKVNVKLHPEHHCPYSLDEKGASFLILEPNVWWDEHFNTLANTKNSISIKGVLHYYDNYTRRLSTTERDCVFEDEQHSDDYKTLPGLVYMKENCVSLCQQEHLMKYCNCTLDYFYPPSNFTRCSIRDLLCLAEYNDIFRVYHGPGEEKYIPITVPGFKCECLLNCYSLTYIVDHHPVPYSDNELLNSNNESTITFEFYFKIDFGLVFHTNLIYTWVDLLVSFGGITALFLGCSFISFLELCYFLFIRLPSWFWQKRNHHKFKRRKSEECVNNLLLLELKQKV